MRTKEEWKDLIVENLVTDEDIDKIIDNERKLNEIKKIIDNPDHWAMLDIKKIMLVEGEEKQV